MIATRLTTYSIKDVLGAQENALLRTPGVHVTDLIELVIKKIDPDLYSKEFDPKTRENWMHAGFLWERVLGRVFQPDQALRCHEIDRDGIIGTPDWIEYDETGPVPMLLIGESKATWKSARGFDDPTPAAGLDQIKFLAWKIQIMAYCYMVGMVAARLHVLFINGEYTAYIPEVRSYLLVFDDRELVENWQMLRNTGVKAGLL